MTTVDQYDIDKELVWLLRNNVTDPLSRGSSGSQNYTATASQSVFVITQAGVTNITSVTVDSVSKTYGTDYTISESTTTSNYTVTFNTPLSGGEAVSIGYHYGGTWIYPDMPREDVQIGSYPRIGIKTLDSSMIEIDLGAAMTQTSTLKEIAVFSRNLSQLRSIINSVKTTIINNKKSLYNVQLMLPAGIGPIGNVPGRSQELLSQSMTVEFPFIFES